MKQNERVVYSGKYITVTEEIYGSQVFERMQLRRGVCVIPMRLGENSVSQALLINEYRTHEGAARWKAVTGWVDKPGLSTLEIAQEELAEEIGMEAQQWHALPQYDLTDRTINAQTEYFIAHDPQRMENPPENPDSDEVRAVRWVEQSTYEAMLENGDVMWDRDALYILQALKMFVPEKQSVA